MDIKNTLFELSNASSLGSVDTASKIAYKYMSEFCSAEINGKTVIGKLQGESDYTLLIDAHIDEVGMIVTDVDENGFLTVASCGSLDLRHLSAKPVIIHGKKDITGVFVSTPPHLKKQDSVADSISEIKIDTALGSKAREIISVGDFVTYSSKAFSLSGGLVCGKSLDNRAGVVCVIELCRRLSRQALPCSVVFLLSDAEELGLRGVKTAAFGIKADEAVAIDVSFGDGPDISPLHCGKMGCGAMIGVSPVLDRSIKDKLHAVASENGIPYQSEIMGGNTSTNADALSLIKSGIKTGLISVPLRNMHTDTEIVNTSDIESACSILEKYILAGGVKND